MFRRLKVQPLQDAKQEAQKASGLMTFKSLWRHNLKGTISGSLKMMQPDADKRRRPLEVLQHPFLTAAPQKLWMQKQLRVMAFQWFCAGVPVGGATEPCVAAMPGVITHHAPSRGHTLPHPPGYVNALLRCTLNFWKYCLWLKCWSAYK